MKFDPFLEEIKQQMQPEGRVQHLVGMLQPLLASLPEDVTLADLVTGWQLLAHPRSSEQEPASLEHRREVCGKLAVVANSLTREPGKLEGAVRGWQTWQETCQKSSDPRLTAMAKTLARELVELQSAC